MRPDLLRNGLRSRPVLPKLSKTRVPGSGVLGRPSLRRTATITHGTGTACVRLGPLGWCLLRTLPALYQRLRLVLALLPKEEID